jgi:hypothetical protein
MVGLAAYGQGYGPALEVVQGGGKVRLGMTREMVMRGLQDCCDVKPSSIPSDSSTVWVKLKTSKDWTDSGQITFDTHQLLDSAQRDLGNFDSGDTPFDLARTLCVALANSTRERHLVIVAAGGDTQLAGTENVNDDIELQTEPGKLLTVRILDAPHASPSPIIKTVTVSESISRKMFLLATRATAREK